jgi:hypothetical protein
VRIDESTGRVSRAEGGRSVGMAEAMTVVACVAVRGVEKDEGEL